MAVTALAAVTIAACNMMGGGDMGANRGANSTTR